MNPPLRFWSVVMGLILAIVSAMPLAPAGGLLAQSSKAKTKPRPASSSNVKQLDSRVTEMQEQLLRDATDISKGYEDAGQYDRAKWMLEVLEKLNPKLPGLKEKIEELTDKSLDATEFEIDMDVSKGWTPAIGMVQQGRIVRITTTGEYKFVATLPVTADGLPVNDSGSELVPGIPVGALMGVIVDAKDKKPGKPFEIKAQREWTPRESGFLQLKVNLPSGHKSTGKLTITFGGVAQLPS